MIVDFFIQLLRLGIEFHDFLNEPPVIAYNTRLRENSRISYDPVSNI